MQHDKLENTVEKGFVNCQSDQTGEQLQEQGRQLSQVKSEPNSTPNGSEDSKPRALEFTDTPLRESSPNVSTPNVSDDPKVPAVELFKSPPTVAAAATELTFEIDAETTFAILGNGDPLVVPPGFNKSRSVFKSFSSKVGRRESSN